MSDSPSIAVVLPCYKSKTQVLDVIGRIGKEVQHIFAVDDACPDGTGKHIEATSKDKRVHVLYHTENKGVGGAVKTGYAAALEAGADIVVKIDSDGQMDPALLPRIIAPIVQGQADYTKGNRFFNPEDVHAMPRARLIGNAGLSFLTKLSTGYWNLFDPANGYTAIHRTALELLPLHKINDGFFFETDILFRLNTIRAVVVDVPMRAIYAEEVSNLRLTHAFFDFSYRHLKALGKRIFYMYFLRDFSVASIELVLGLCMLVFGMVFGTFQWLESFATGELASAGTVMISALPIILGTQLLVAFLAHDSQSVPRLPLSIFRKS